MSSVAFIAGGLVLEHCGASAHVLQEVFEAMEVSEAAFTLGRELLSRSGRCRRVREVWRGSSSRRMLRLRLRLLRLLMPLVAVSEGRVRECGGEGCDAWNRLGHLRV